MAAVAMSVSIATLVQLVRRRLHEANNSVVGEMPTGTGGAATVSGENGIIEALNRVASDICRTCFYYEATGSASTSARAFPLSGLSSVTPTSAILWMPLQVAQGAGLTALAYVNKGVLSASSSLTTSTGTPLYWMDYGEGSIELSPSPSGSLTITVRGAAIPPVMTSGGSAADFMDDATLQKILPAGAAARIAMAEVDNPALAARGPLWQAEYDAERMRLWSGTAALIRHRCFPNPPGVM